MFFPENRKIKITVGLHKFCNRKIQCHNDKDAKESVLCQSSKHGHWNTPEELGVNPAGEEWQEWGSSAGEGKAGAEERDHGSDRDNVLVSKRLSPPAFEKTKQSRVAAVAQ